jgi:LPS O-antigen subunit length determinant protein (WzzB/FepE family)
MAMDRTYLSAGIVILVGVVVMAIAVAMLLAISPNYWNDIEYGTTADWVKDGKQADMFSAILDVGLLVVFVGIAIMAFGLASSFSPPPQYRPVETMIPPQQYQPQQYQPQQNPQQEHPPKP